MYFSYAKRLTRFDWALSQNPEKHSQNPEKHSQNPQNADTNKLFDFSIVLNIFILYAIKSILWPVSKEKKQINFKK